MKKFLTNRLSVMLIAIVMIPGLSFTPLKNTAAAQSWEKLGQRKVNFKVDRDDIYVGRYEGFLTALKIKVRRGSINMIKMEVQFGSVESKNVPLKNNFNDGDESRVIDLPGNRRMIRNVTFWYESTGTTEGNKPIVELWGRH